MSIHDSISSYSSEEKYISEFEEISKSKDVTSEKCLKLFESCRAQFQGLALSGAPSPEQIKETITFLKTDLEQKKTKLAKEIVQSGLNLLDPEVYKKFPPSLRFDIAKYFGEQKDATLSEMIKAYEITDQDAIFALVKHKIEFDPLLIVREFASYGIQDEQKRFELAKMIALGEWGMGCMLFYPYFNISDPNKTFELVKIMVQRYPEGIDTSGAKRLEEIITDPQQGYEILCMIPQADPGCLVEKLEIWKIEDPDKRFHLAELMARARGALVLPFLDKLGVKDANQILRIYSLCYEHAMKQYYLQGDKDPFASLIQEKGFPASQAVRLKDAISLEIPVDVEATPQKAEWESKVDLLLKFVYLGTGFSKARIKSLVDKIILERTLFNSG